MDRHSRNKFTQFHYGIKITKVKILIIFTRQLPCQTSCKKDKEVRIFTILEPVFSPVKRRQTVASEMLHLPDFRVGTTWGFLCPMCLNHFHSY